jgi:deoxyribodipyrimidine photolyase-related protein
VTTVWITGDQCSPHHSALAASDPAQTVVLMIESIARGGMIRYHKRKLVLIYASMRSFARELRAKGWTVDYHAESPDFAAAFEEHLRRYRPECIRMMQQSEYGPAQRFAALIAKHGLALEVTPHCNFISTKDEFDRLFGGKTRLTMETFYRAMRRKTHLLMDPSGEPEGGAWNFDAENRLPPKDGMRFRAPFVPPLHAQTREAIAMVERHFGDHPGEIGAFDLPVTRADALAAARDFIEHRLDDFGPYEDAMLAGERVLNHSRLSAAINVGLLHPLELCEMAQAAYYNGAVKLQSAEGFIRQLIGWREFIWQIYWRFMPEYRERNALGADLPLPSMYWTGETEMRCMSEVLRDVRETGWTHHIPRLMVLGNFGLIAGIVPQQLNDWFWAMFVDGYDWVMVPNVIGMTLHADGGIVGTKPYAASANYIDKMSNYCKSCRYDRKDATGENACPFNTFYWDFIGRNHARFAKNQRMTMIVRSYERMDEAKRRAIARRASALRAQLHRA